MLTACKGAGEKPDSSADLERRPRSVLIISPSFRAPCGLGADPRGHRTSVGYARRPAVQLSQRRVRDGSRTEHILARSGAVWRTGASICPPQRRPHFSINLRRGPTNAGQRAKFLAASVQRSGTMSAHLESSRKTACPTPRNRTAISSTPGLGGECASERLAWKRAPLRAIPRRRTNAPVRARRPHEPERRHDFAHTRSVHLTFQNSRH